MPRYEFSEGTSNKFWEINLTGKAFTTTFGKIGSKGQTKLKEFRTPAAAKTAYEALIAEKVKKGYVAAGARNGKAASAKPAAPARPDVRNPALEAAIVANPDDRDAWAIYGDWLQEQGDPRGEVIALELGGKAKQAKKLFDQHPEHFLGPLAEHQTVRDEGANNGSSQLRTPAQEKEWQKTHRQAFLWRYGFIRRLRLSHDYYSVEWDGKVVDALDLVLRHPSARFIVEFAFHSNADPNENNLQSVIDLLGKKAPATTRKITFGDNVDQISWHHTGNLGKLWKGVPNLTTLEIETGEFDVGKMIAPALQRAIFLTGGLSKSCGKNIATAQMPAIEHLEIYYGDDNYGGDCTIKEVRPLLARTDLPKLRYLGLKNAQFQNDIASAVVAAPIVKQLATLDLSLGAMTDEGARALNEGKAALKHLACLDLRGNYLTADGVKLVKGLAKQVLAGDQRQPYRRASGELRYFVSVSE